MKFDYLEELESLANELGLSRSEFILLGGSSLNYASIRNHRDIDICIYPSKRKRIVEEIFGKEASENMVGKTIKISENVEINKGDVFRLWGISDEELLDNYKYSFSMDGFKIVRLEMMYSKKLFRCTQLSSFRFKDLYDVYLIDKARRTLDFWDEELVLYPKTEREIKKARRILLFSRIFGRLRFCLTFAKRTNRISFLSL